MATPFAKVSQELAFQLLLVEADIAKNKVKLAHLEIDYRIKRQEFESAAKAEAQLLENQTN